jgi:sec-independent protein translocase protein TatA
VDSRPCRDCGTIEELFPIRIRDEEDFVIEGLFQPTHLILIFGIALLVFGPKKLPELGKGLGDGIRGFKAAMNPEASSGTNSREDKKDGPEV